MIGRVRSDSTRESGARSHALWTLRTIPPETVFELEDWLDSLGELSLDRWVSIAGCCATSDRASLPITRACQRVERAITEQGLEFDAWLVRDLVETATFRARQAASDRPRSVRARLSVARMAAEWAALAKLCRPWLPSADYELLCTPFGESGSARNSAAG